MTGRKHSPESEFSMHTQISRQGVEPVEAAEVEQTLERILKSRYFVHAHKKQKFLRFICDYYLQNRAHELNEYVLAYDVFGRDQTYNPSADPIVRVVAREIRQKLETYYQKEGSGDDIRMEIPSGSYQPVFIHQKGHNGQAGAVDHSIYTDQGFQGKTTRNELWLTPGKILTGLLILALSLTVVVLLLSNLSLRSRVSGTNIDASAGELWTPFLKDPIPPIIVLSNPVVLRFLRSNEPAEPATDVINLNPEDIKKLGENIRLRPSGLVQGTRENGIDTAGNNAETQNVSGKLLSKLILSDKSFTGLGEAIGLYHLTRFFQIAGIEAPLKQSRTLSVEDLKNRNVILLGGAFVNEWSGKLPDNEVFVYTDSVTIANRSPRPGEQREYRPQFDWKTGELLVDYALISVKPNIINTNKVIVLSGCYSQGTEAAAEFVTNRSRLNDLHQKLIEVSHPGPIPSHYQILLKVDVEKGIPATITILAIHKLP